MPGNPCKILVHSQEGVAVLAASSSDQEVGWTGQHSLRPTDRSEFGSIDVGRTIHIQQRERLKELH